ncbi:MAG TPA: hypothetical protein PLV25_07350, partial [Opitutales bacterium]|nr:hypothetical protein [Opitutales bacterium]
MTSSDISDVHSIYWLRSTSTHQVELGPWGHPQHHNALDTLMTECQHNDMPIEGYISHAYTNACGDYVLSHVWPQFDGGGRFCGVIGVEIPTAEF